MLDLKTVVDLATILATGIAAFSVFTLAKQIKISVEEEKMKRSHDFIKRYNDPVYGKMLSDALIFLQNESEYVGIFDMGNRSPEAVKIRQVVAISLNFFEEMSMLYNRNLLNRDLIKDYFIYVSSYYYEKAEKFIRFRVDLLNRPQYMEEWRVMNDTLRLATR